VSSSAIVVAAHHVQTLSERGAVALLERSPLGLGAVVRQVTFHDHGGGVDASDLGYRAAVHHVGVGRFPWSATQDRPVRVVVDAPALGFAEVHVVDGREPAQQLADWSHPRVRGNAVEVVVRVRTQPVIAKGLLTQVQHDRVVGDGGQLECVDRHLSARDGRAWPCGHAATTAR